MVSVKLVVKKTLATLLFLFAITANSQTLEDWSTLDKSLLVASTAANMVDWGQTRTIAKNPHLWREQNPMLDDHPTVNRVNAYFLSRLIAVPLAAHYFPKYRTEILSVWLAVGVGYAAHNHSIGIRMSW